MDFYTADLHLAHPKLAQLRGFDTTTAHDAAVLASLYDLDPDQDRLWVLGDVSTGGVDSTRVALDQLRGVPVPMHLITGNHDRCHPMYRGAERHTGDYLAVFESVSQFARSKVGDVGVLLSHFPYRGTPDRLSRQQLDQWQLPDLGQWLIHGHTHSGVRRSGKRSICVSLEAWKLRPASAIELEAEMGLPVG